MAHDDIPPKGSMARLALDLANCRPALTAQDGKESLKSIPPTYNV